MACGQRGAERVSPVAGKAGQSSNLSLGEGRAWQRLGPVSLAAVSNARAKMVRRLLADQGLRRARVEAIALSLRAGADKVKLED